MKHIFILFILLCQLTLVAQINDEFPISCNDLKLKGNVKSMTESHFYPKSNTDTSLYLQYKYSYTIDSACNVIGSKRYHRNSTPENHSKFYYDKAGNLAYFTMQTTDKIQFTAKYRYDTMKHRITGLHYNGQGEPIYKYLLEYDKNGNCIKKLTCSLDTLEITGKETFKYDSKNRKIEYCYFYPNLEEIYKKQVYTYQENQTILINLHEGKTVTWKEVSKFDQNGNTIEESTYKQNGKPDRKKTFKFDKSNNEIERKTYDYSYKHEYSETTIVIYDVQGNWTKKTRDTNGKLSDVITREIVYE